MRTALAILLTSLATLGTNTAYSQSAFLDKGQSGTAVGISYLHERGVTALGLGVGLSTESKSDVNLAVFSSKSDRTTAYGGGVGLTLLGSSEDTGVFPGLSFTIEGVDPPGRGGPTVTGSVGLSLDFPVLTGGGTRFVLSIGGSIGYLLSADHIPGDRTCEIIHVSMGQTISTGTGNYWLLSLTAGYTTVSPSHGFVGFELGFLLPD
jgi:hypothetical protein